MVPAKSGAARRRQRAAPDKLNGRTEQAATNVQQTASTMAQMTSAVQSNAAATCEADNLSVAARDSAVKGGAAVSEVVSTMGDSPAIGTAVAGRGGPLGRMLLIAEQIEAGRYRAALASCRAAFGPELAAHLANWMP